MSDLLKVTFATEKAEKREDYDILTAEKITHGSDLRQLRYSCFLLDFIGQRELLPNMLNRAEQTYHA